jgi:hypothetical protein
VSRARVQVEVGGRLSEAETLWYDTKRWPSFIDGFAHLQSVDPGWPREGRLVWDSRPDGRGRVVEQVVRHAPGDGQDTDFEDEKMTGTQSLRFAPAGEDRVRVSLEQRWSLKAAYPGAAVVDAIFIRRAVRDALHRTLRRFAIELRSDRELR